MKNTRTTHFDNNPSQTITHLNPNPDIYIYIYRQQREQIPPYNKSLQKGHPYHGNQSTEGDLLSDLLSNVAAGGKQRGTNTMRHQNTLYKKRHDMNETPYKTNHPKHNIQHCRFIWKWRHTHPPFELTGTFPLKHKNHGWRLQKGIKGSITVPEKLLSTATPNFEKINLQTEQQSLRFQEKAVFGLPYSTPT